MVLQPTSTPSTLLPCSIAGNGSAILNATDLHASTGKSTKSRLGAGSGGLGTIATFDIILKVTNISPVCYVNIYEACSVPVALSLMWRAVIPRVLIFSATSCWGILEIAH